MAEDQSREQMRLATEIGAAFVRELLEGLPRMDLALQAGATKVSFNGKLTIVAKEGRYLADFQPTVSAPHPPPEYKLAF